MLQVVAHQVVHMCSIGVVLVQRQGTSTRQMPFGPLMCACAQTTLVTPMRGTSSSCEARWCKPVQVVHSWAQSDNGLRSVAPQQALPGVLPETCCRFAVLVHQEETFVTTVSDKASLEQVTLTL